MHTATLPVAFGWLQSSLVVIGLLYMACSDGCIHKFTSVPRLRPYPMRGHWVLYVGQQYNSTEQPQAVINHLLSSMWYPHNITPSSAQHSASGSITAMHSIQRNPAGSSHAADLVTLQMRQRESMLDVAVLTKKPKHDSSAYMQAADMSALWLKEIHLENTLPSHSQPLVHSVPWQLAHHALVYPQERHIEV